MRFEVVGGPARGQLAYYEAKRADAARCPNLAWRGPLPHADIDGVLAGALALVHTGVTLSGAPTQEGFPNIYLEAWRNGLPVLTLHYDPDGVIARAGLGCRCGTIERMAAELERLAADPALRERIASSARGYVRREHDADRILAMYRALFDDILEGG
jgi:glycosyltransferase involved in cell wall biosynthesis